MNYRDFLSFSMQNRIEKDELSAYIRSKFISSFLNMWQHPHPFAVFCAFFRASYIFFWAWLCHFIQPLSIKCHNYLCLVVLHVICIHNAILLQPSSYLKVYLLHLLTEFSYSWLNGSIMRIGEPSQLSFTFGL